VTSCETCGNAKLRLATGKWECQLSKEEQTLCHKTYYGKWVEQEGVEGIINAGILAEEVGALIYNQSKAKIFNLLEAQMDCDGVRMRACKQIAQDIIALIAKDASELIKNVLGDWQAEVVGYGEISDPEEAEKEYAKVKSILK